MGDLTTGMKWLLGDIYYTTSVLYLKLSNCIDLNDYDLEPMNGGNEHICKESFINSYVSEWIESVHDATMRLCMILDSKYEKADLDKSITKQCKHLYS